MSITREYDKFHPKAGHARVVGGLIQVFKEDFIFMQVSL
jgi:hypothetical protein